MSVAGNAVSAVTMVDAYAGHDVQISKQDIAGAEIAGAKLTVTDSNGTTKSTWVSVAGQTHVVKGLTPGKYTLTELTAPDGYEMAESIEFEVGLDGKVKVGTNTVSKVVMTDAYAKIPVIIRKVELDNDGKEVLLSGAKLRIYHENGSQKVIDDEWSTTANEHPINLVPGTYFLEEETAPAGYDKAASMKFTVSADKKIAIIRNVKDVNGNTRESSSVQVNGKVTMIDEKSDNKFDVKISKVDTAGAAVAGAVLDISTATSEGKTSVVVESWETTANEKVKTVRLAAGTYILHEAAIPTGYIGAKDITFVVASDGKVTVDKKEVSTITMTDAMTKVSITKTDSAGKALAGAALELKDSTGKTVDSWTSSAGTRVYTGVLKAGATYTLHESKAPNGYAVAEDIQFTVRNDSTELQVVMKDNTVAEEVQQSPEQTGNLRVTKQVAGEGADTTKKFGFIVTLTKDGKPLTGTYDMTFMGAAGKITFNALGQAGFELAHNESLTIYNIPVNVSYTVQELDYSADGYVATVTTNAHSGMKEGENLVQFTNSKTASAAAPAQPTQGVAVTSTISRPTGDNSGIVLAAAMAGIAVMAAGLIWYFRRRKAN